MLDWVGREGLSEEVALSWRTGKNQPCKDVRGEYFRQRVGQLQRHCGCGNEFLWSIVRPSSGCSGWRQAAGPLWTKSRKAGGQQKWVVHMLLRAGHALLSSSHGCTVVKHTATLTQNAAKKGASQTGVGAEGLQTLTWWLSQLSGLCFGSVLRF